MVDSLEEVNLTILVSRAAVGAFSRAFSVLAAATFLLAFAFVSSGFAVSGDGTSIRFLHYWTGSLSGGIDNLVQAYNRSNPQLPVSVKGMEHESFKGAILALLAGGGAPDIFSYWAGARVGALVDAGKLRTFADIYRLTRDDLLLLERMGEKSAANVLASIASTKDRSLDRLLAGIGIRHVGNTVARALAAEFGSLDAIVAADVSRLAAVEGVGEIIAQAVHDFLRSDSGRHVIAELKRAGIDPRQHVGARPGAGPLAGKTVVVTGTLSRFTRDQIEQRIRDLGGKSSGSVSAKTSLLVAGEKAGSKLDKARQFGVEVVDEDEFVRRFGAG